MGTVATSREAAGARRRGREAGSGRFRSAAELREVLDRALASVDADERGGAILAATGLRLRFRFPDLDTTLDVAASDDPEHHLSWSFEADAGFEPRLTLAMDSDVANRYLQGRESLPIAILHGRVRCSGTARTALAYVPAARRIGEPYTRIVRAEYPHLALR